MYTIPKTHDNSNDKKYCDNNTSSSPGAGCHHSGAILVVINFNIFLIAKTY